MEDKLNRLTSEEELDAISKGYNVIDRYGNRYKYDPIYVPKKDITNDIFGRLTALRPLRKYKSSVVYWECECSCGSNIKVYSPAYRLVSGETKSCGCYKIDFASNITSESVSAALKAAPVSVEKYGFPVPQANITTLPLSKCFAAFLFMYGSATSLISIAV